jgi:hypothetical protein
MPNINRNTDNEEEYFEEYSVDYDDSDIIYEPDEIGPTKFSIVLCELHNVELHGLLQGSEVKYHYLVISRYKKLDIDYISECADNFNLNYAYLVSVNDTRVTSHPIYKNYKNITSREDYVKPEIAECILLETQEYVAILKTVWIKLIQRTWKNILKKRKEIIMKRSNPNSLHYREIHGSWPKECANYPTLKGMLSGMKFTA